MTWTEVLAPAKINLFLELTGKRSDGFHELETVMTTVGLYDRLFIRRRLDSEITLSQIPVAPQGQLDSDADRSMPLDSSNLICKAFDLLRDAADRPIGVDIAVQKQIPPQGGLGGGSSDAAATLIGVNRVWQLGFSQDRLAEMANEMGSDIAFFLHSDSAVCRGRGELVSSITTDRCFWTCIAMPPKGLSTAEVFRNATVPSTPNSASSMISAIGSGRISTVMNLLSNRLQQVASQLSPWVDRLANQFSQVGCRGHQLTGSGAAYFGLFASRGEAFRACQKMRTRQTETTFYCVPASGSNATLTKHRA